MRPALGRPLDPVDDDRLEWHEVAQVRDRQRAMDVRGRLEAEGLVARVRVTRTRGGATYHVDLASDPGPGPARRRRRRERPRR